ncbi:MAG TPA: ATP-binding protein, partial [Candidatus Dormibacteraeota bacterium]|nr:ATP-binding protein [Candidatus Dormibacteraeota bacterium]
MPRILCPVLVGRESELAQLDGAVDAAQHGRGGVLFVTGPAGVGKSRLVAEAIARAGARHIATIAGRCVPSATPVPYRPLAEALLGAPQSALLRDTRELAPYRAALSWMVPAWRDPTTPLAPESPVVVAEALVRTLEAMAAHAAVVLLVEDAQWSDPETLHAVEYLADHAHTTHVLCLCTLRDDEPSEARALVERLDSRRAADVVRLSPLTAAQVSEMAGRSLGT